MQCRARLVHNPLPWERHARSISKPHVLGCRFFWSLRKCYVVEPLVVTEPQNPASKMAGNKELYVVVGTGLIQRFHGYKAG